jgi:hypothetical protein
MVGDIGLRDRVRGDLHAQLTVDQGVEVAGEPYGGQMHAEYRTSPVRPSLG